MKTIWKFQLDITQRQKIELSIGFEILDVQLQDSLPCLWVLVDPVATPETVFIRIHGTGHQIQDHPGRYISTFQRGSFVFHVFQEKAA